MPPSKAYKLLIEHLPEYCLNAQKVCTCPGKVVQVKPSVHRSLFGWLFFQAHFGRHDILIMFCVGPIKWRQRPDMTRHIAVDWDATPQLKQIKTIAQPICTYCYSDFFVLISLDNVFWVKFNFFYFTHNNLENYHRPFNRVPPWPVISRAVERSLIRHYENLPMQ